MTRAEISALLARFHIWMRPFVWVQLMFIKRWQMRHRRNALIEVCWATGRLRIVHVGDAPRAANAYHYEAPAIPAWERSALPPPAPDGTPVRASFGLLAGIAPLAYRIQRIKPEPP